MLNRHASGASKMKENISIVTRTPLQNPTAFPQTIPGLPYSQFTPPDTTQLNLSDSVDWLFGLGGPIGGSIPVGEGH